MSVTEINKMGQERMMMHFSFNIEKVYIWISIS